MNASSSGQKASIRFVDTLLASAVLAFMAPVGVVASLALAMEQRRLPITGHATEGPNGLFSRFTFAVGTAGPVSKTIHRTGLDLLPSFWNVLRGDMALIGPVPTPPASKRSAAKRTRPGIIGPSQLAALLDIKVGEAEAIVAEHAKSGGVTQELRMLAQVFTSAIARPVQ